MKKTIMLIILILLSFFVSAETYYTDFYDSFDYSNAFSSHGWAYSNGACGSPSELSIPITSIFGTNAFGTNSTSGCGFGYQRSITKSFSNNFTDIVRINYDFYIQNDTVLSSGQPFSIVVYNSTIATLGDLYFRHNSTGVSLYGYDGSSQTFLCHYSGLIMPYNISAVISIDVLNHVINWQINNYMVCNAVSFSLQYTKFSRISLINYVDDLERVIVQTDNLIVSTSDVLLNNLSIAGEPCESSNDCYTGKCEYGACVYKQVGVSCDYDSQCASGECKNGLCTKASLSQNLENAKNEQFGNDAKTNNIISLFFMIGVPAIIVIMSGGSALGILLSIGLFIVEGFLFTIMGWLSPFILIGIVVFALIIMVFAFMIKGQTN